MKTSNFNMKFVFIILVFKFSWSADLEDPNMDEVNYYENLIISGIDQAIHYQLPTDNEQYRPRENRKAEDLDGPWDFIVVGAGCGGAVVANRLSEIKKWKVLLIEAGGSETNFSTIPAMHIYLHLSKMNWGYYTTEQNSSCLGMQGNRCPIVRGRSLGGSSAINYESYVRGNRDDFNRWAAQGNPGWTYDEVLPYFIKSENFQVNGDPGYHGKNGYWNVKNNRPINDQFLDFMEGSRTIYNFSSTDYNGRDQLGVFQVQVNNIREFRESANKAFLEPIRKRSNLDIITNAYVTKVLINPLRRNAIGVEFAKDGKLYTAKARKEVVLSAGPINTPQILMLSGIGPREHLEQMNIPLIKELPVGKTLYDHAVFYAAFIGTNFTQPNLSLRQQIIEFLKDYGSLTMYSNIQAVAFYRTKLEANPSYPDLEMIVSLPKPLELDTFLIRDLRLRNETYHSIMNSLVYESIINTFQYVMKPQSVGSVTLKSKDPYQHPNIDPNYLDEKYDLEILYEGIQIVKKIIKTEPLRKINATLILIDYPQCRGHKLGSKDYWICAIRLMTASAYHQCGTCRMGPNPETSVVNNNGLVHGFKNLRIIDSSIFPSMVAGHTAAPTVMIAEKISDLIKWQYKVPIQPITNVIN